MPYVVTVTSARTCKLPRRLSTTVDVSERPIAARNILCTIPSGLGTTVDIGTHKNRYRKRGLDFQSPYDPFLSHSLPSQVTPPRAHTTPKQKQPIMLYHLPFYTHSPIPEWYIHRRKQVRPPKQFVVHRIKLYPRAN